MCFNVCVPLQLHTFQAVSSPRASPNPPQFRCKSKGGLKCPFRAERFGNGAISSGGGSETNSGGLEMAICVSVTALSIHEPTETHWIRTGSSEKDGLRVVLETVTDKVATRQLHLTRKDERSIVAPPMANLSGTPMTHRCCCIPSQHLRLRCSRGVFF